MIIGNREFADSGRTYFMGILNVTPDSFSDGGRYYKNVDAAVLHAERMINEGTDIIDIGGESTRPGFTPVGEDEELRRVIPILTAIKERFDVPVSVDTFHYKVAKEAVLCGADLINDVRGLKYDNGEMARVIKDAGASVCIMHNSDTVTKAEGGGRKAAAEGMGEIVSGLAESISIAKKAGIKGDRIMVDPGVGFAKDYHMNMAAAANAGMLKELGYPVLLGVSNKSLIGITLDIPVEERLSGTIALSVLAAEAGISFLRVHDVKNNKMAVRMAEEVLRFRL